MSTKEPKTRRPKARPTAIVIGAMEERLSSLIAVTKDPIYVELHATRLGELLDELKRSLGGRTAETEEVTV